MPIADQGFQTFYVAKALGESVYPSCKLYISKQTYPTGASGYGACIVEWRESARGNLEEHVIKYFGMMEKRIDILDKVVADLEKCADQRLKEASANMSRSYSTTTDSSFE
jgi:hypothetical protein